tara:strand:+ start:18100 stop:18855 length:756 start_codon:yes stop_codon:yes gene_type:complete
MNKVLVIGDSCTDIHIYGRCDRLSPEAPVPVFNPIKKIKNGGMARNVLANLKTMNVDVQIITNPNNITKSRYIDDKTNSIMLRVDEDDYTDKIDSDELKKVKNNTYGNYKFDGLIISDYCKGFLSEKDIQYLINNNSNVFLDTKKILGDWMYGVDFVKINEVEYEKTKKYIDEKTLSSSLIITKGSDGCQYKDIIYPVPQVDGVKDYSGAGDTFMSGFVCEYLKSFNVKKSINYAQECATIVVQKHGVATI